MRRALLLVLLAGCGDSGPIPQEELFRVTAGVSEVELGRPFPLTVVRVWRKARAQAAWSDDALAPLAVQPEGTARREDERFIEETRRFTARAFTFGKLPVDVTVKPTLDPDAPGRPELPELPKRPAPWWLLFGLFGLLALRRRKKEPEPVEPEPVEERTGPEVLALQRLSAGPDEDELVALLRDYVAERFGERAHVQTSQEIAAAHAALTGCLRHCDLVRFARRAPAGRDQAVLEAEAFVRETSCA